MTRQVAAPGTPGPGQSAAGGVHRLVIRRHAEDAAFYWARRQDASLSAAHDLHSLTRFDFLLDAHLEGLRVAQLEGQPPDKAGWEPTWERTQRWKTADEAFVAAVLALELVAFRGRTAALFTLEELVCDQFDGTLGVADPSLARGLASAAAWLAWPTIERMVQRWSHSHEPALRRCALAACALHQVPAGAALSAWLNDPHPQVRARALRAVGELGRADLAAQLLDRLDAETAHAPGSRQSRTWAAWSLCLLGHAEHWPAGPDATCEDAGSSAAVALLAAWSVAAPPEHVAAWVDTALQDQSRWRDAIAVIRYSGQARWLPVLLQLIEHQLEKPALDNFFEEPRSNLARLAADAFAHISGLRLADQHWMPQPEATNGADDEAAMNPGVSAARKQDIDHGLLWPDLHAVKRWWNAHGHRFGPGGEHAGRYLGGQPLMPSCGAVVLTSPTATQLQRHHAALYLRCVGVTKTLFDVRAHVRLQRTRAADAGLILS